MAEAMMGDRVNWFDGLLIAMVCCSGALALRKGLVREATALLGWMAGFVVASRGAGSVAGWLSGRITGGGGRVGTVAGGVGTFLLLLVVSLLAATLLGRLVHRLVDPAGLSPANRFLGLGFGLARGALIVLVGFLVLMLFNVPEPVWMSGSRLAPVCRAGVSHVVRWLPSDFPLLERLGQSTVRSQPSPQWVPPAPW